MKLTHTDGRKHAGSSNCLNNRAFTPFLIPWSLSKHYSLGPKSCIELIILLLNWEVCYHTDHKAESKCFCFIPAWKLIRVKCTQFSTVHWLYSPCYVGASRVTFLQLFPLMSRTKYCSPEKQRNYQWWLIFNIATTNNFFWYNVLRICQSKLRHAMQKLFSNKEIF